MSSTKIPRSKAKTAYGLLSEVRRLILEEPKRYNQRWWIARLDGKNGALYLSREQDDIVPACGTVACVAGWVATLKVGNRFTADMAEYVATQKLGLDSDQALELFKESAVPMNLTPQTEAYAKAGAAHIASFQKKYAAQLKAKRVRR